MTTDSRIDQNTDNDNGPVRLQQESPFNSMNTLTEIQPAAPFSIGLKPLDSHAFLQIDDRLSDYRAQKRELYARDFDKMCMAEPDTLAAQTEVDDLIRDNLKQFHPQSYTFLGDVAQPTDGSPPVCHNQEMPIASTALLVQDDLVLMRRDETGWRLVAASLCFPSSWNLQEKFGRPLDQIHGPVPMDQKMTDRINRIFDGLRPEIPVWRANWSLDGDGDLRHDRIERHRTNKREKLKGEVYFRTEYQTLHKLPLSGDILFTIRIATGPIRDLVQWPGGRKKIALLEKQYHAMTDAERSYKGIQHNAEKLLDWLRANGDYHD